MCHWLLISPDMRGLLRIPVFLLAGVLAAGAFFSLMQWMISPEAPDLGLSEPVPAMEFVRLVKDTETRTKDRDHPDEPPANQPPPQMPDIEMHIPQVQASRPSPNLNIPGVDLSFKGPNIGPVRQGPADRSALAVSRTPPQYPYNAARRKVEGWVKLSFEVTETGAVKDVVIVEAQPPNVFDQAARRAIYKWKFKPAIENGKPVASRATQTLEFKLDR